MYQHPAIISLDYIYHYRVVQLDLIPAIEVFHMLFERCHTKNRKRSVKQHIKYFNFRSKVLLDHPVHSLPSCISYYSVP